MTEPVRTPIEPSFIRRVSEGFRYAVQGVTPTGWFSPSQPIAPVAQDEAKGRAWDYMSGYNIQISPRAGEPVGFQTLRNLADGYDLLRLVIETRKDQLERLPWTIVFRDEKKTDDANDPRVKEVRQRLMRPDGRLTWRQWSRMVLEDMLVLDAPTVYVRRTNGGGLFALEPLDGSTIAPKIDDSGRVPLEGVAYQQIIKGVPACDYTTEELIYYPRNLRTSKVYGYSPVEQVITTVNIALRRQIAQLGYYTEGNLPETLISVPKEWSVDQIKQFDEHFNSVLEGKAAFKRRGHFVPDGTKPYQIKDNPLKDEMDDWLARIVCYAFSVSPQGLIQMQNRATAQVGASEAAKEGLEPLKLWMADFVNECILKGWGYDDIEFKWQEEEAIDPLIQAQVNQIYINAKVLTPNEVRADLGREPIEGGDEMAQATAKVPQGEDNKGDSNKEVGKSADAPFWLAKFLPDTEQHDADGTQDRDPSTIVRDNEDDDSSEIAAALIGLLIPWRKNVWLELGQAGNPPADDGSGAWAIDYARKTVNYINATTAKKIKEAVDAAQQGPSSTMDDVSAKIRAVFNEARKSRSNIISDTMSTAVFGMASLKAMISAGVEEADWITERDGRVRPTHSVMDGQRQKVGGFFLSPSGAMALCPGCFGVAAEDANCRCHLRPVIMLKSDVSNDDFWRARDAIRAKGAERLARVIRRIFARQKKAVMAAMNKE